jgi:DNA-binding NarL/FixJ family response regulator
LTGDAGAAAEFEAEAEADARRAGTPGALFWIKGGPRWSQAEPRVATAAGLTDREMEVLALLAAGYSNQEIADQLVLSIRTVQRHVENIYAKTGARGRAAASVFAATHGLVAPNPGHPLS